MEIIDAHAHIYERLSGFGPRGEARAIGGGMIEWATGEKERFLRAEHGDYGFSYDMLLSLMQKAEVGHAVLLQCSNYGFQNSYTAEAVEKNPDKFTGAGTFDPYAKNADLIFDNLTGALGFGILKFELSEGYGLVGYHPDLTADSKIFEPYLKACEDMNITIVFDTGFLGTKSCRTDCIINVAKRHKNLNILVAHSLFPCEDGENEHRLELIKEMKRENIFFDVAGILPPGCPQERFNYIKKVMDIVGSEHIAWGSDCPGALIRHGYRELIDHICENGGFSGCELENLMSNTARYIYKIET